jgi:hypothetical protein
MALCASWLCAVACRSRSRRSGYPALPRRQNAARIKRLGSSEMIAFVATLAAYGSAIVLISRAMAVVFAE